MLRLLNDGEQLRRLLLQLAIARVWFQRGLAVVATHAKVLKVLFLLIVLEAIAASERAT